MTVAFSKGRKLYWQVYLHGMLLLGVVALALLVAGIVVGRRPPGRMYPERLGTYLSARADDVIGRPALLARDLRREHELTGIEVTIYALDGRELASNVEPPVPAVSRDELARLQDHPVHVRGRGLRMAVPVRQDGRVVAYAALGGVRPGEHLVHVASILAIVLAVLALASALLARKIAAPLEHLTATAQRLGAGELSARTGFRGRGEVGRLGAALDDMAERLQRLLRAEKELLANVSHELRTPLARMRVALELAEEGDHEAARRSLQEIGADVTDLQHLVDSVLAVSRLELMGGSGGAPPLRPEPCDVTALLDRAADRFRGSHAGRTVTVEAGAGELRLRGDEALVARVLDNLLENAAKYSRTDSPITLAAAPVTAGGASGGMVALEVRDCGIGIAEADQAQLFLPFFRSEEARRLAPGVGLGLTLVKRVVDAHGGRVEVSSRTGEGTTVRVLLPIA